MLAQTRMHLKVKLSPAIPRLLLSRSKPNLIFKTPLSWLNITLLKTFFVVHLPVLCYQNIDPVLHDDLTYKAGNIKNHFRILKENGYETITCHHLCENLNGKLSLPEKPIIISFDNGYAAYRHYLLEPLQENNFNATFFVAAMNPYEINRIPVSETISCNKLLKKIASKGYKKLW